MRYSGELEIKSTACGAAVVGYSDVFELSNVVKIGLEVIAVSEGDVDVGVELEVSNSKVATTFDEQDSYSDLLALTDEVTHRKTVVDADIPGFKYGRIAFVGGGAGNHASTTVSGSINLIRDEL